MAYLEVRQPDLTTGRKTKSYRVRYIDAAGIRRSRSFRYKADAEAFIRKLEQAKAGGQSFNPDAGRETLRAYTERAWLPSIALRKPKTRAGYESLLRSRVLPAFGDRLLREIEPDDVEAWIGAMVASGLSPSRTRQAYRVLSSIFKKAVRDRRVTVSPCRDIDLPAMQESEVQCPEPWEVEAILERIDNPTYRLLVRVLAAMGLRWAEAVGLRRGRINLDRATIEIIETLSEASGKLYEDETTKRRKRRTLAIPPHLLDELAAHLASLPSDRRAYVFTTPTGKPIRYPNFRTRIWEPAALGTGYTLHHLRHFTATMMLQGGASVVTVAEYLGHSTPAVTLKVYAHVLQADKRAAAEIMSRVFTSSPHTAPTATSNVVDLDTARRETPS